MGHFHSPWVLHLVSSGPASHVTFPSITLTSQIWNLRILLCDPHWSFIRSFFLWSLTTVITRTFILLNTLSSSFSWPSLESVVLYPTPFLFSQNQHCASCVLKQVHSGCFPSCRHQHTALPAVVISSLFLLFPKGGKKKLFFFFSLVNRKETAISYQPRLIESSFNIVMGKRLNFSGTRMWG